MTKIALTPNPSGTGTFTIAAPNSDTNRTITLPDEDVVLAGPPPELTQLQVEDPTSTVMGVVSGQRFGQFRDKFMLGWGQTIQTVTASRALGTTYTNSTGRPIVVMVNCTAGAANSFARLLVDGEPAFNFQGYATGANGTVLGIVPDGITYRCDVISGSITVSSWLEIR